MIFVKIFRKHKILQENTKEKIIACPLDDCGLKTNIWERLKLIQRLKKDFASTKQEFEKEFERV